MGFRVISKAAFGRMVRSLQQQYRVVGPKPVAGEYIFAEIESADDGAIALHLDYTQTVVPPKKYLLPQHEEIARFNLDGSVIAPVLDAPPTVILGIHTCDLHALQLLDKVFAAGYVDQHYRKRRENVWLIGIECLRPCTQHSFCKSMGTLTAPDNFDLHLTDLGDPAKDGGAGEYAVDIGTERGEALLQAHAETRFATDADYQHLNAVLSEKWPRFSYRLDFDVSELPSLMRMSYHSHLWEELGKRCLACGSCTNVCPTCYCFNVKDEVDFALSVGTRTRTRTCASTSSITLSWAAASDTVTAPSQLVYLIYEAPAAGGESYTTPTFTTTAGATTFTISTNVASAIFRNEACRSAAAGIAPPGGNRR